MVIFLKKLALYSVMAIYIILTNVLMITLMSKKPDDSNLRANQLWGAVIGLVMSILTVVSMWVGVSLHEIEKALGD